MIEGAADLLVVDEFPVTVSLGVAPMPSNIDEMAARAATGSLVSAAAASESPFCSDAAKDRRVSSGDSEDRKHPDTVPTITAHTHISAHHRRMLRANSRGRPDAKMRRAIVR